MYFYYNIDLRGLVDDGHDIPPPFLLHILLRGLPDDSWTAASLRGEGREGLGWGTQTHLLCDISEGIAQNTINTGHWKKRPDFQPYERPRGEVDKKKVRESDGSPLDRIAKMFGR